MISPQFLFASEDLVRLLVLSQNQTMSCFLELHTIQIGESQCAFQPLGTMATSGTFAGVPVVNIVGVHSVHIPGTGMLCVHGCTCSWGFVQFISYCVPLRTSSHTWHSWCLSCFPCHYCSSIAIFINLSARMQEFMLCEQRIPAAKDFSG
jgi:hypothetical protein